MYRKLAFAWIKITGDMEWWAAVWVITEHCYSSARGSVDSDVGRSHSRWSTRKEGGMEDDGNRWK